MTHTLVPEELTDLGDTFRNELAASILVALAQANIPTDVQELLVYGNPMHDIPPGALSKACAVVWRAAIDNIPKLQPDAVKALVEAAKEVLSACEIDAGNPDDHEGDDGAVGSTKFDDGEFKDMALTFAMMRSLRTALRPFLKEGE